MLVKKVLVGIKSVRPVSGDVEGYPTVADGNRESTVVVLDPGGSKLFPLAPVLLGNDPSEGDSESEGDADSDIELPSLPFKAEVEETPLGPAVVSKSDGPAEPLGSSPTGYEVDMPGTPDDCSMPICP